MKLIILKSVMNDMRAFFSMHSYEIGGVLLGKENVISSYIFDEGVLNSAVFYVPDVKKMNLQIKSKIEDGFQFFGFVHSHFERMALSVSDILYAKKTIELNNVDNMMMFLYVIKNDKFICYIVSKDTDALDPQLEPVPIKEI